MSKKILVITLGCKVNQFETAAFQAGFAAAGMELVNPGQMADLVVINTCAVTAGAGAQSRQTIRQVLRQNPRAEIVITGCYAELAAKELAADPALEGRSYILIGNSLKDRLVAMALESKEDRPAVVMGSVGEAREICRLPIRKFGDRTRAYLRVQDGCDSYCTYCIVPYTRGPSRSLPLAEVVEQAEIFAEAGHREIVLTGIHLGYYGKDLPEDVGLTTLLDRLTLATPRVRYRISSLEPLEISDDLLALLQERSNLQPHLHIPLQSGCDAILAQMNRRYTVAQFRQVVDRCLERLPDAAIGIDILAGFPGETDRHFQAGMDFLKSLPCSYLHVFPYSLRPGTPAATYKSQVPKPVKEARAAALRRLSDEKRHKFYHSQLRRIRPVLVERRREGDGLLQGFTDNYVAVRFAGPEQMCNTVTSVKLLRLDDDGVLGERVIDHEN